LPEQNAGNGCATEEETPITRRKIPARIYGGKSSDGFSNYATRYFGISAHWDAGIRWLKKSHRRHFFASTAPPGTDCRSTTCVPGCFAWRGTYASTAGGTTNTIRPPCGTKGPAGSGVPRFGARSRAAGSPSRADPAPRGGGLRLPELQRVCMQLKAQGLRYHEIAVALDISMTAAVDCVRSAVKRLGRRFRD